MNAAAKKLQKQLNDSDAAIKLAKEVLNNSERGRVVLDDLHCFLNRGAGGLDSQGLQALHVLVTEFCFNHRRGVI